MASKFVLAICILAPAALAMSRLQPPVPFESRLPLSSSFYYEYRFMDVQGNLFKCEWGLCYEGAGICPLNGGPMKVVLQSSQCSFSRLHYLLRSGDICCPDGYRMVCCEKLKEV